MDIALVCERNFLSDSLIDKLHKEGHRIYAVTGEDYRRIRLPKVFEQYNFSLENDNISEILESIHPDCVVWFGGYDSRLDENMDEKKASHYMNGLVHTLTSLNAREEGSCRFIYLSSEQTFAGFDYRHKSPISEEESPQPQSAFQRINIQAERLVMNFASEKFMPVILRLDNLYGMPDGAGDFAFMKSLNVMINEAVTEAKIIPKGELTSLTHVGDAVEYIYSIISAEKLEHGTYHLSSKYVISERKLAEYVVSGLKRAGMDAVIEKTDNEDETAEGGLVLSAERFRGEFVAKVFDDASVSVAKITERIVKHRAKYIKEEEKQLTTKDKII